MYKLLFTAGAFATLFYGTPASAMSCHDCKTKTEADCVNFFNLSQDECEKFAEENCKDIGDC